MPSLMRRLWLMWPLLCCGLGAEAQEQRTWSVSPYAGLYKPKLDALNDGLFRVPYGGTAQNIDVFGATNNTRFFYRTPLPELDPGVTAGLEFKWNLNERHAVLIGAGTWESTSYATAAGNFPVQGNFEAAQSYRKGQLSYNEFYLGWRYNFVRKPDKLNLYLRLSAHEIFDLDYREDFSLLFLSGPPKSFRRSLVVLAQATGLLALQGGGGGEWFVNDWLSLSLEGGYVMGVKKQSLGDALIKTDFLDTDNLDLDVPIAPNPRTGEVEYLLESGERRPLHLDFGGWKALLKFTIYY